MKKIYVTALLIALHVFCIAQSKEETIKTTKNNKGSISSVEYPNKVDRSRIPKTAEIFFKDILKLSENDEFRKEPKKQSKKGFIHEHYDQYYNSIRVIGGGYNFHFKNGIMYFAHGNYIRIDNLNIKPSITREAAKEYFVTYKSIPLDVIKNFKIELMIKEIIIDTITTPKLVYRIYINTNHKNNNEVGYIDAHTCKILLTEPIMVQLSNPATFETIYSETQYGNTNFDIISNSYQLKNWNKKIEVKNCMNSNNIDDALEYFDSDNYWAINPSSINDGMGHDVFWGLEHIYDRLKNVHNRNSFNDDVFGFPINAYVRYYHENDRQDFAGWNRDDDYLVFGEGNIVYSPLASIDAIAHEYGHGITDFQIGWNRTLDQQAFNEGLSDIWAAIMEYRIRPNDVWKIGEQITLNNACIRNLENPKDNSALIQMADTYGSTSYNGSQDYYVRSGVFSHWFYLLVEGGSGYNDKGKYYAVHGVGMDVAEDLIVEAVFEKHLNNATSYPSIMQNTTIAAENMNDGGNTVLAQQILNAWYAVGVSLSSPTQVTIVGPSDVCTSGATYTLSNLPSGVTVDWSYSIGLNYVSGQGTTSYTVEPYSSGGGPLPFSVEQISASTASGYEGWVQAEITDASGTSIKVKKEVWVGTPNDEPIVVGDTEIGCGLTLYREQDSKTVTWSTYGPLSIVGDNVGHRCTVEGTGQGIGWVYASTVNDCGSVRGELQVDVDCRILMASPNPASSMLEIEMDEQIIDYTSLEKATLVLYNSRSVPVYNKKFKSNKTSIDVSNLSNGLYQLQVIYKGKKHTKQILVEHK